jgi:hypothetical protein
MLEDRHKTTFVTEWGSYQYTVIPFGLKNAPVMFSRVVVVTFKEFIHKFLELYLDNWMIFSLLQCHISLNLNKCIFLAPFKILLGHIVCKKGLLVDPTKITVIMELASPTSVRHIRTTLGHTCYYRKFIKGYAEITTPMEKLLKKEVNLLWNEDSQKGLDTLKHRVFTAPILVSLDWDKEFHLHVYASSIALGAMLSQIGEGTIDHSNVFTSRKLSVFEKKYTTTEREGPSMVYALHKFKHYLLGSHFKMYTNHSALKYLVNKPILGGIICRWMLLFQEYDFEVILKLGNLNARPDHLSWILT